ncbi:hypothetical protein KJ605_00245 [Patescibacteria group bacterium]|nr:hypothetical protein [Patescibacteria group bacterium]MBU1970199.1 hypothetical protein [Patescibacteria group bacterium]
MRSKRDVLHLKLTFIGLTIFLAALFVCLGIKEGWWSLDLPSAWGRTFSGRTRFYLVESAARGVCRAQLAFQNSVTKEEAASRWEKFLKAEERYGRLAQDYNNWAGTALKNGVELPAGLPTKVAEIAVKYACPD